MEVLLAVLLALIVPALLTYLPLTRLSDGREVELLAPPERSETPLEVRKGTGRARLDRDRPRTADKGERGVYCAECWDREVGV